MADVTGARLTDLEALTTAAVSAGDTGEVTDTSRFYICETADGAGSTWYPCDGAFHVRDLSDTTATSWVQEAVDRANASSVVKTVYCRGATWTVNQTVLLEDGIEIRGAGPRATLFRFTTGTFPAFQTNATYGPSPTISRPVLRDFSIDHATTGNAGTAGINFRNVIAGHISNVEVRNLAEYGIRVGDESHDVILEGCDVRGADYGYRFENGIRSCHMVNGCVTKNSVIAGVLIKEGADAGVSNLGIHNCSINSFPIGVKMEADSLGGVFHVVVEDCRLESGVAGAVGVDIGANVRFVGLFWNHNQQLDAGNRVVDRTTEPSPSELLSIEMPIFYGTVIGGVDGTRGPRLSTGNGAPNGVLDGDSGARYYDRDTGFEYRKTTAQGTLTGWVRSGNFIHPDGMSNGGQQG
jgi:hypothetical protein